MTQAHLPPPSLTTRRSHASPAFTEKLSHMSLPLSPLVQVDTGRIHPSFPKLLINFWLLTEPELDSLATFYHQRHLSCWTYEYPARAEWHDGLSLEQKRRRFGRFIGLRGCESPRVPVAVPRFFEGGGGAGMGVSEGRDHGLRGFGAAQDGLRGGERRGLGADAGAELGLGFGLGFAEDDPDAMGFGGSISRPRAPWSPLSPAPGPPPYRADPDPDIEMTFPAEDPPRYTQEDGDSEMSFRRRDPGDDELTIQKTTWYY